MWNVRICDGSVRLSFSLKLHNLHTIRWHKRVHIKMDCTVICIINDDGKDRILTSLHYVKDPLHVCTYKRTESKSATKIEIERLQIANEKKKHEHSGHASHSTANISIVCRRRYIYMHACRHCLLTNAAFVNSHYGWNACIAYRYILWMGPYALFPSSQEIESQR